MLAAILSLTCRGAVESFTRTAGLFWACADGEEGMRKWSMCLLNVFDVQLFFFFEVGIICGIFREFVEVHVHEKMTIFYQCDLPLKNCRSHSNQCFQIQPFFFLNLVFAYSPRFRVSFINHAYNKHAHCKEHWVKPTTEWFGDIKLNSLSVVFFCSGLDGDGEGERDGERRQTWESWFFSMWTPLQISWNVLGGLALPVSSVVFPAFPLLSLDELMLTSCSWEPLLPWLP